MTRRMIAEEPHKHKWECVASENGYYRLVCQIPGCHATKPYPDVQPQTKRSETWADRCKREAGYSR